MRRHWQYLKYVLRHKWYVYRAGRQLGLGILQLLAHDLSKFHPREWFPYARTFYAPDGTKQYQPGYEFASAWGHHQHVNRHHWQYWLNAGAIPLSHTNVVVWDKGNASILIDGMIYNWDGAITVREPMPDKYRREMLADWRGAGQALGNTDTRGWYLDNYYNIRIARETRIWLDEQLLGIASGVTADEWAQSHNADVEIFR